MTNTTRRNTRTEMLGRDEEDSLVRTAQNSTQKDAAEAMDRILEAYMPLLTKMARANCERRPDLFEDLMSEASCTFIDVVKNRYDPDNPHNARIGSFARHYVHAAMRHFMRDNITCTRLATNTGDKRAFHGYQRERANWEQETGRTLDEEGKKEIARRLRVDLKTMERMAPRLDCCDVSVEQLHDRNTDIRPIAHVASRAASNISGEDPEGDASMHIDGERIGHALHSALSVLGPLERRILETRHLTDGSGKMLRDIADEEGITRKNAKNHETNALRKIRREIANQGLNATSCL